MAVGEWMSAHGFDPRYIRQEVGMEVEKHLPGGVVENPQAVIHGAIASVSPSPASAVLVSTTPAVEREVVVPVTVERTVTVMPSERLTAFSPRSTIVGVAQPATIMSAQPTQGFVPTLQAATMDALRVPSLSPMA